MKVTIHQPDLLPYSGFWFKMATCDAFVLSVHDQFQKHGYQRRVKMRDAWCSHQLVGKPALVPINAIEVARGLAATDHGRDSRSLHRLEALPPRGAPSSSTASSRRRARASTRSTSR